MYGPAASQALSQSHLQGQPAAMLVPGQFQGKAAGGAPQPGAWATNGSSPVLPLGSTGPPAPQDRVRQGRRGPRLPWWTADRPEQGKRRTVSWSGEGTQQVGQRESDTRATPGSVPPTRVVKRVKMLCVCLPPFERKGRDSDSWAVPFW